MIVFIRRRTSCWLLLLLVSGCQTNHHGSLVRAPDWESEDVASSKSPAPASQPSPQLTIFEPPAPVSTNAAFETWIPLNRWSTANGFGLPSCLGLVPLPTYELKAGRGSLILRTGSQLAQWDGLEIRLGFAPQLINGGVFVHTLDLQKTIQPLLRSLASGMSGSGSRLEPSRSPVIVIDPGHGGENAGARSVLGNGYEKEFTLDWARRLQWVLATNGWRVLLTRTNDTDLALPSRVAFAEEHKADVFLSLHFNSAAPDGSQAGLETYCLTPAGMPSTVTRGFNDDASAVFPNNSFDVQNLRLALKVHRALLQAEGNRDRGIRRARFLGVLRGQQRPAILIEGGYLSNPREARLISEPEYRQKLAEAVAHGLLSEDLWASLGPEIAN